MANSVCIATWNILAHRFAHVPGINPINSDRECDIMRVIFNMLFKHTNCIICLQEVEPEFFQRLVQTIDDSRVRSFFAPHSDAVWPIQQYPHLCPADFNPPPINIGTAILAKVEANVSFEKIALDTQTGFVATCVSVPVYNDLRVLSVHAANTPALQSTHLEFLQTMLNSQQNLVVAGDLNNATALAKHTNLRLRTYRANAKHDDFSAHDDAIACSEPNKITNTQYWQMTTQPGLSDHAGVTCEYNFSCRPSFSNFRCVLQ